jgi:hypothetical protein
MERYDYFDNICKDIKTALATDYAEEPREFESLYEKMFLDDSITGNASGSYFFSRWKAEEAICHNIDLLEETINEFGLPKREESQIFEAEYWDVAIRCYLLAEALTKVLEKGAKYNTTHWER